MQRLNRSNRKFNRSQRRRYQDSDDDAVNIDWGKPLKQIALEILQPISRKDALPKNQLLAYLNCFTKYCLKRSRDQSSTNDHPPSSGQSVPSLEIDNHENDAELEAFSDNEVLCCLRLSLFHDAAEVRAASLRAIRYYVQSKKALHCLLELNLQHLIARSLDIVLENRIERVQALRLIRHLLSIEPNIFPLALARCLCAIAGDNSLEKDMLLRAAWATIAELTTVNAIVSARAGCVNVMVKCAMNSALGVTSNSSGEFGIGRDVMRDRGQMNMNNPMANGMTATPGGTMTTLSLPYTNIAIAEAILSSFLHLYNWPDTRRLLQPRGLDLFYFISPFTDTYSFLHASNAARNNMNPLNFDMIDPLEEHQQAFEQKDAKPFLTAIQNRQGNKQQQQQNANYEYRTLRYLACKNAILSILRSWPGMFYMCRAMVDPESKSMIALSDGKDNLWDYSEIYRQTGERTMRSLLDSLRFFGIPDQAMPTTNKLTQMVSGIGKAMDTNCPPVSTYFTTTSYDSLNPLESLISILYLPYPEIHRHLLDLIYELFGIRSPDWVENFDDALRCVYFAYPLKRTKQTKVNALNSFDLSANQQSKNNYFPEEWQLYDGFVAKEAEHILPSLANTRLNYITNYYALLLQAIVEVGILEALVSVILDSSDKAAVNLSTILLGELLHLSGKYLPASSYAHRCQSLPTLVAASLSNCKTRRNRALMAITHLNQIHELKKRGPKAASLFLEQQIYFCQGSQHNAKAHKSFSTKSSDENVTNLIKNSLVLKKANFKDWNWELIMDILKHPGESLRKLEDKDTHRVFVRRLLDFFRPSRRLFSLVSKNSSLGSFDMMSPPNQTLNNRNEPIHVENPRLLSTAAIYFIDFLLDADESRISELVEEFVVDLDLSLKSVAHKSPPADEVLLPSRLLSTLSHHYFLLLGRFTHSSIGRRWLERTHIFQWLLDLISLATNDVYMKLIVSSLDYGEANVMCRSILSKVLTSTPESSRLYATQYLRVLLRARAPNFADWAIDFLIVQIYDRCSAVSLTAIDILDEACSDDEVCLEKIISHRPSVLHLGDIGVIFLARFACHPDGLAYLKESNMLENELSRWSTHFSARYVRLVEDSLNECFSCHQRNDYGTFGRRSDRRHFPHSKRVSTTSFLPPHLYGQLVQTEEGLEIVREKQIVPTLLAVLRDNIDKLIETEHCTSAMSEATVLRLKASLWSIGHLATTEWSLTYVIQCEMSTLLWISTIAQRCPVLSLRATSFYVLCLFASTRKGAQLLSEFGWTAIQHSHHETFPINQQEYDSFYHNGRPRFMSDPEKANQTPRTPTIVPIPLANVFFGSASIEPSAVPTRHYSQSSSRSSSSSYLSMQAPTLVQANKASLDPLNKLEDHKPENSHPRIFTMMSSSSSSASIYSNTSSIGNLMSSTTMATAVYNRPRSSSDCVPTITPSVEKKSALANKQSDTQLQHSKPEYQDSGILEISNSSANDSARLNLSKVEGTPLPVSPSRNRKISAPCQFAVTAESNRENRSDSNDSARTANTALFSSCTGSRSTSFAEYSTSSSGSGNTVDPPKADRNVSFSPETATLESHHVDVPVSPGLPKEPSITSKFNSKFDRSLAYRQMSVLIHTDDPYPSSTDAHGYAQLRAIQKRRVQSLSGNMFFSGIAGPNSILEQFYLEPEPNQSGKSAKSSSRPHSNSLKGEDMPEILINDSNTLNGTRQRKISRTSLPPTSPIDPIDTTGELKRLLRIPSANSVEDTITSQSSAYSKSFSRSFSRVSKGSFNSVDSVGTMGLDELSFGESHSLFGPKGEKSSFMCLCLPDNLSYIFYIDEDTPTTPKTKRVQFSSELEQKPIVNSHDSNNSEPSQNNRSTPKRKISTVSRPCISQDNVFERRASYSKGLELHSTVRCMACCLSLNKHRMGQNNLKSPNYVSSKQFDFSDKDGISSSVIPGTPSSVATPNSSQNTSYILQRKEVLRLVANLSAAMYAKQSEQGLLSFKQKFPSIFEDFCLYSEVCLQIEQNNFRATARRFLHELFLDVNLDQLYKDVELIFKHRTMKVASSTKLLVPE